MSPQKVLLRKVALGIPFVLAALLIILIPVYSRLHRNPMVPVKGAQTWALNDPLYPEAYQHAANALLATNPGLRPEDLGQFDPARVWELGEGRYRIRVAYQSPGPDGTRTGKEAQCVVKFDRNAWTVESAEAISEFVHRSNSAETAPAASGRQP